MVYLVCQLCRSARRAETLTRCGKNTALKWLTFNYERWNHLRWDCVYVKETETYLKWNHIFLGFGYVKTSSLSGLALSEFRLRSMIKPGEVQLFLTWMALPWWKSSSKPPAETLGQRVPKQEQREDLSCSPQHPHDQCFWPLVNCKSWNQTWERKRFEGLVFTGRELEGTLYFCSLTSVIFKNYVTVIQRAGL